MKTKLLSVVFLALALGACKKGAESKGTATEAVSSGPPVVAATSEPRAEVAAPPTATATATATAAAGASSSAAPSGEGAVPPVHGDTGSSPGTSPDAIGSSSSASAH